jgi:hypothetical protein
MVSHAHTIGETLQPYYIPLSCPRWYLRTSEGRRAINGQTTHSVALFFCVFDISSSMSLI